MRVRTGTGLALLVVLGAIGSTCSGPQSASPTASPAAGDLAGIRIEVHEAPG